MWSLKKTVFIDCRVREVHQFATNPRFWYQWYAGLSEPENLLGNGGKGTSMDLNYTFFGRYLALHVLVVENARVDDSYVWRCLITGAFEATQTWRYLPKEEGTEVRFEMDYELPGSILGKLVNTLYLKKLMDNSVEQTLKNLKDICESD
ncbi:SRPBCC family protein [Planococcus salinus]|uniref:SRPBCC family protein n=1 Tax=Planococcus salinus TaxID=1848460 RepID=A0A3M8P582_9BACL|nr:SRPBCC family protein [Planococcus salinus]RNF38829.1 SRPBCC family protein [Planococcus salinus]